MKILVVEDDQHTRDYLRKGLLEAGHSVDTAEDGLAGLDLATQATESESSTAYDALIVDRMLPRLDGLSLVRGLRESGHQTPALILSALGEVDDRVKGLNAGGDDYLVKPFAFSELLARLEAIARRAAPDASATRLQVADLELDLLTRTARRDGTPIPLKPREFRLLHFLMSREGQVVTRTMLLEGVWDYHFDPQTNVVDVHVSRLRQKVDKPFSRPLIHTVRGAGYRVDATSAGAGVEPAPVT